MPEIIVGVVLLGLLMMMGAALVNAAKRLWPDQSVKVEGDILPVAPSAACYADAVRFHGALLEKIEGARAIYVFGGSHVGLPASASCIGGAPLAIAALPELSELSVLPLDAESFYQMYSSALGPRAATFDPGDFTVVIIGRVGDRLGVTGIAQVRRTSAVVSDGTEAMTYSRRQATFWQTGETLTYAFLEKDHGADTESVGARHFWQRYAEGKVAEEGPVLTIFPDPWVLAGAHLNPRGDAMHAFSQFLYVLTVSP